jgi:hypothetical protein
MNTPRRVGQTTEGVSDYESAGTRRPHVDAVVSTSIGVRVDRGDAGNRSPKEKS